MSHLLVCVRERCRGESWILVSTHLPRLVFQWPNIGIFWGTIKARIFHTPCARTLINKNKKNPKGSNFLNQFIPFSLPKIRKLIFLYRQTNIKQSRNILLHNWTQIQYIFQSNYVYTVFGIISISADKSNNQLFYKQKRNLPFNQKFCKKTKVKPKKISLFPRL